MRAGQRVGTVVAALAAVHRMPIQTRTSAVAAAAAVSSPRTG